MSIIEDKRIMSFLADYKAFDDFPAVKQVMKTVAEDGYGKELCRLAADESDAEYVRYAAKLKNTLAADKNFKKEFADYVVDSISLALGLTSSLTEPGDHGFDPENYGNSVAQGATNTQQSSAATSPARPNTNTGKSLPSDKISETVIRIIVEQLGVNPYDVKLDSSFVDDLGADSLDTVELVMALEEKFDLEIQDEDAEKITTVRGAIDYIKAHV